MCEICEFTFCDFRCPNHQYFVVGSCELCGEEIIVGNTYYEINGTLYCEECIKKSKRDAEYDNI